MVGTHSVTCQGRRDTQAISRVSKTIIDFVTRDYPSLSGMKAIKKYPPKKRLRELRNARGLSMEKLASMIGREKPLIYKLEHGLTRYNETVLNALARALEVSPMELLKDEQDGDPAGPSMSMQDAIPYEITQDSGALPPIADQQVLYEMKSLVLDQIGLFPGDILIIDISPNFLDILDDGDVVVAQAHEGDRTAIIVRQFLAPSMLVSNSSGMNPPVINIRSEDVGIKGVMRSSHRVKARARRH